MKPKHYTEQQFIEAVKSSISIREVLIKLNLKEYGNNYVTAKKYIKELNLDVSHHLGQAHNKNKNLTKIPIEDYLSNKTRIHSHILKKRLIKEKYFEHKCYSCNLHTWKNKPIAIELHHIDGNHSNNNLENLMIVCPNCHAQIHQDKKKIKIKKSKNTNICVDCQKNISHKANRCKSCTAVLKQKATTKRPPKNILEEDLKSMSYVAIGKKYGVSDNSVRKWEKFYNKKQ